MSTGIRAEVCTHEIIKVTPGTSGEALELVRSHAIEAYEPHGWTLAGAWWTTMPTRMKSSCCGLFPRATPLGPPANTHRSRILRC